MLRRGLSHTKLLLGFLVGLYVSCQSLPVGCDLRKLLQANQNRCWSRSRDIRQGPFILRVHEPHDAGQGCTCMSVHRGDSSATSHQIK